MPAPGVHVVLFQRHRDAPVFDRETGQIIRIGNDMAVNSQVRGIADGSNTTRVLQDQRRQANCRDQQIGCVFLADGNQLVDRIRGQVAVNDRGHNQLVELDLALVVIEERGVGGVTTGGYPHQGLPRR